MRDSGMSCVFAAKSGMVGNYGLTDGVRQISHLLTVAFC